MIVLMEIVTPTLIVGGAGLALGLILALFSKIMAVPVDERQVEIREMLPGANCGACGHSTCDGYSKALADGTETRTNLCKPGGDQTSMDLANYLGSDFQDVAETTAMVMCQGSCANVTKTVEYKGVMSCAMANQLSGGDSSCRFGCLGYGDCTRVCQFEAIHMVDGVAVVDPARCTSCEMCINTCPKSIIELMIMEKAHSMVLCRNEDKAALANKACKVSCISCRKCVKSCPENCIEIVNNRAVIDYEKCTNCGECQLVCPHDCILSLFPANVPV